MGGVGVPWLGWAFGRGSGTGLPGTVRLPLHSQYASAPLFFPRQCEPKSSYSNSSRTSAGALPFIRCTVFVK